MPQLKTLNTIAIESEYTKILLNLFKRIDLIFKERLRSRTGIIFRQDSLQDDIASFIEQWVIWIQRLEFPQLIHIFARINVLSQQQVKSVLGINPVSENPELVEASKLFIRQNVSLIKNLLAQHYNDVEQIIYKKILDGEGFNDLAEAINPFTNSTEKHAVIIARDQTTKYYARLNEYRYQSFGFDHYIWHTSHDERVRETHARLDNTKQSFNKPPITVDTGKRTGERNNPGGDILCRCWAEPI